MEIAQINIKACASLSDVIVLERDKTHALVQIKAGGCIRVIELSELLEKPKYL